LHNETRLSRDRMWGHVQTGRRTRGARARERDPAVSMGKNLEKRKYNRTWLSESLRAESDTSIITRVLFSRNAMLFIRRFSFSARNDRPPLHSALLCIKRIEMILRSRYFIGNVAQRNNLELCRQRENCESRAVLLMQRKRDRAVVI